MTAIVPGVAWAAAAELAKDKPEGLPTYRCTDCTLMRCHIPGTSCSECLEHAAQQQAEPKTGMICVGCNAAWEAGQVTCPYCGGYLGTLC